MNALLSPYEFKRLCLAFSYLQITLLFVGCQNSSPRISTGSNVDRLMEIYPELHQGRFVVIADFQNPNHMQLFQLISTSGRASFIFEPGRGRRETGAACGLFTSYANDDTLVISNDKASHWHMKRNWREFDLLMLSAHTTNRDVTLHISIEAGPPGVYPAEETIVPMDRGWNHVRLDLAEAAEHLPVDDVRKITLTLSGSDKIIDLRLDDIILTSNRKELFGDSTNTTGNLYIQQVGRRWRIGAGGKFELTFANGQIVGWYNLSTDPYRLHNLVTGTILGPEPVVLDDQKRLNRDFSSLGKVVVSHPKIIEMNSVRIVVVSDWRFVNHPKNPLLDRPFQRWMYTIYPTGQIFVAVEATSATDSFNPEQMGLSVSGANPAKNPVQTFVNTIASDGENGNENQPIFAWMRDTAVNTTMLFIPLHATDIIEQIDSTRESVSFVAVDVPGLKNIKRWISQLCLTTSSELSKELAVMRATAFQHPPMPELEFGSFVPTESIAGSGMTVHGFNPATGCYVIKPENGMVRFVLDHKQQWFTPTFKIPDPHNRKVSVYINHMIYKNIARDRDGNLIFQLLEPLQKRTLVDVLFRPAISP